MIQIGVWTGQRWAQKDNLCVEYRVRAFYPDVAEILLERIPMDRRDPYWATDLSRFVKSHRLVSND